MSHATDQARVSPTGPASGLDAGAVARVRAGSRDAYDLRRYRATEARARRLLADALDALAEAEAVIPAQGPLDADTLLVAADALAGAAAVAFAVLDVMAPPRATGG